MNIPPKLFGLLVKEVSDPAEKLSGFFCFLGLPQCLPHPNRAEGIWDLRSEIRRPLAVL